MRLSYPSSLAVATVLCLAGCAGLQNVAPPLTPAMLQTETRPGQLAEGRRIFTTKCTACHALPAIADHSIAKWPDLVDEMAPRSRLDATAKVALLAYLQAARANL